MNVVFSVLKKAPEFEANKLLASEKLAKFKESLEKIVAKQKSYSKKMKASYGENEGCSEEDGEFESMCHDICCMMEDIHCLYGNVSYLFDCIDRIYNALYEHYEGHLPKINSVAQMQAAIKALGLDGDYEVKKQQVYLASALNRVGVKKVDI